MKKNVKFYCTTYKNKVIGDGIREIRSTEEVRYNYYVPKGGNTQFKLSENSEFKHQEIIDCSACGDSHYLEDCPYSVNENS